MARHQRARLHAATIELVDEGGYEALTVTAIARAAGVSNRTFYDNFQDKEDCFLSTYDRIVRHVLREILVAQRGKDDCREKLEAGFGVLMSEVAAKPKAARLALIEVFAVGASSARMRHTSGLFETLVTESCNSDSYAQVVPPLIVNGIVAGISGVARTRLLAGEEAELASDAGGLLDWVLSFHSEEARATLPRQAQASPARAGEPGLDLRFGHVEELEDDRAMILSAASKIARDEGYAALTVPRIRVGAGVSRRRFDEHFEGVEDCFLAALELRFAQIFERVRTAFREEDEWAQGVHRALAAICQQVAEDPVLVKLFVFELSAAGRASIRWRSELIARLASSFCCSAPPEMRPTDLAAEASIAAAWGVMHRCAATGRAAQLPQLAPTVSHLVLAPFVDVETMARLGIEEREGSSLA